MTDFLLVHGAGDSAWSWGRVWGYMTAPAVHPPPLDRPRPVEQVVALDLPGHGSRDRARAHQVTVEECVQAVAQAVQDHGLRQPVLVGHSFAPALLLKALAQLPQPPRRLVLVAGLVPGPQDTLLSLLPRRHRAGFHLLCILSRLAGKQLQLPRPILRRYVANGLTPEEAVQAAGRRGPLPVQVLKARFGLGEIKPPCPVTYVVLTGDRLVPPPLQRRMAQRIPGVEILELDSCHAAMLHRPRELAQLLLRYA